MRVPLVAITFLTYAASSISALTSYFVAMVVSHPGDSYPKSDDSYLRNWLFRTHFVWVEMRFHQLIRLTVSLVFVAGH